jgi:hypothetical protein
MQYSGQTLTPKIRRNKVAQVVQPGQGAAPQGPAPQQPQGRPIFWTPPDQHGNQYPFYYDRNGNPKFMPGFQPPAAQQALPLQNQWAPPQPGLQGGNPIQAAPQQAPAAVVVQRPARTWGRTLGILFLMLAGILLCGLLTFFAGPQIVDLIEDVRYGLELAGQPAGQCSKPYAPGWDGGGNGETVANGQEASEGLVWLYLEKNSRGENIGRSTPVKKLPSHGNKIHAWLVLEECGSNVAPDVKGVDQ